MPSAPCPPREALCCCPLHPLFAIVLTRSDGMEAGRIKEASCHIVAFRKRPDVSSKVFLAFAAKSDRRQRLRGVARSCQPHSLGPHDLSFRGLKSPQISRQDSAGSTRRHLARRSYDPFSRSYFLAGAEAGAGPAPVGAGMTGTDFDSCSRSS